MGLQLQEFVDKCIDIAAGRGLASDYPVKLRVTEPASSTETIVVVSYSEPHYLILPLNVTWIDGNPASDDYKIPFKRTSKNSSGGLQHTWEELTTYAEIFEPSQYYAPEDNPEPVYGSAELESIIDELTSSKLDKTGGTLTGPLATRTLATGENYQQTEVVPLSYLTSRLNQQTQGFYTIIMSLMRRVSAVETLAGNNKYRLDNLDIGDGSDGGSGGNTGSGVVSFIHEQTEASDTWTIEHNFGTDNILYAIYDEEKDQVFPVKTSIVQNTSNNTSVILFSEDVAGKAILVKA